MECLQGLFNGHKDAVVEFNWINSLCVSGDRSGNMMVWDINTGQSMRSIPGVHRGAVSKIEFFSDGTQNLIFSVGSKDGTLSAVDMRTHGSVFK